MIYLENDICNFEILTNYDRNKKYNILSTCFFKMNNHYKNFLIYINRLKKLISLLETQNKYFLRIFIDENIKNDESIFSFLKKSKKIQIILFKCANFMNNGFHFDVFGTLVRLFPLFDFKNNDANNVIVVDIDLNKDDLVKLKKLMNYNTNNSEIVGMGTTNNLLIMKQEPHYFCGCLAVYNKKFNREIITDFIKNAHNIKDTGYYGKRLTPFGYGIDEMFVNKYLIYKEPIDYTKSMTLGILLQYNIFYFLYHYQNELLIEKPNESYKYIKYILGKYYSEGMSLQEMFKKLDELTYEINSYDPKKIYVSERFYEVIDELYKNKKEWFFFENIKLIKKYFYGIVDCIAILFFSKNTLKIHDVKIIATNQYK